MNYKSILSILLQVAIVSCTTQQEEVTLMTKGAKIHAHTAHTRTSFDGERTKWSSGDQLKVAIGATNESLQIAEFSLHDAQAGIFGNELLALNQNLRYNAYALYSAQGISPTTSTKSATVQIGASSQTQDGTSTSHIAPLDPLFGKAEDVRADAIGMQMYHSAVVLRLNIKNQTLGTINGISSVKVVAPTGVTLSGERTIDLTAEPRDAISGEGGSNTLTINVNSSGGISQGSTFTVWAAAAPFVMEAGSTMQFVVTTTDNKVLEYSKSFAEEVAFEAGSIMQTTIAPAPRAEKIVLKWGYLEGYTQPAGMPESNAQDIEDVDNTTTTFYIDSYPINIETECKFAYIPVSQCIRFSNVAKEKDVLIRLPKIPDYVISQVCTHITEAAANAGRPIKIEITSSNNQNFEPITQTTNQIINQYDLSNRTVADDDYYLHIFYSRNTSGTADFDLTGIELTYTSE